MGLAEGLTRFSLRHPLPCLAAILLPTLWLASGIPRLSHETTARTFLGPDHPFIAEYDDHLATFGGGYFVIIAYGCEDSGLCETVFDDAALLMAAEVSRRLEREFGVRSVESPAVTPILVGEGGGIELRRLVEEGRVSADRDALAAIAVRDRLWQRTVIGGEGRVGAVVVDLVSTGSDVQRSLVAAIEEALAPHREAGWRFHLVGEVVDFAYAGIYAEQEAARMAIPMFAVLSLCLWFFLRSLSMVILVIGSMGFAYAWTQGAMGWLGIPVNALTAVTPSLVLAVGILDGVHLVTRFEARLGRADPGADREAVLIDVSGEIGRACLLATLTTMAAFLSFVGAGISAFSQFGCSAAFGIGVAFVLTFSLLPMLLARIPARWLPARERGARRESMLRGLSELVAQNGRLILLATLGLVILAGLGLTRLRVQISPEHLVGVANPVTHWSRFVAQNLRASESLEIALQLPAGTPAAEPASLAVIDALRTWIDSEVEGVHHPRAITDVLSRLNQAIHEDDPAFERPAETAEENGQLLFLLVLQRPQAVEQWLSEVEGPARLRVSAEVDSGMPTNLQARVIEQVEAHLEATLPEGWSFEITGSLPLYLRMMGALQHAQMLSFGRAAVVIFVLMWIFLRSPVLAVLAMVPSLVPCLTTLGFLGFFGPGLDPGGSMVAAIVLGVAVDDSIHILIAHQRARRRTGDPGAAVDLALKDVAAPVSVSSLVLTSGFAVLTLSAFSTVASFGVLAGIAVMSALLADLLVLPALLRTSWVARLLPAPRGGVR